MLVSFASSWLPSSKLLVNAWALSTRAYERQGWGLRAFVQNLEDRRRGTRLAQLLDRVWHQWWESHLPFWVNPKHGHTPVGNFLEGGMEELPRQNPGCPWMIPPNMLKRLTGMGSSPWLCDTLQDLLSFWELLRFHVFCLCFLVRSSQTLASHLAVISSFLVTQYTFLIISYLSFTFHWVTCGQQKSKTIKRKKFLH